MALLCFIILTHWGRVTHICVSKLTIIGSDNGLSPGRRQAIIWTNDGILLIRTFRTHFSAIVSEIHTFSFKKIHLKMSSGKWRPFCLGLNVLTHCGLVMPYGIMNLRLCACLVPSHYSTWINADFLQIESSETSFNEIFIITTEGNDALQNGACKIAAILLKSWSVYYLWDELHHDGQKLYCEMMFILWKLPWLFKKKKKGLRPVDSKFALWSYLFSLVCFCIIFGMYVLSLSLISY